MSEKFEQDQQFSDEYSPLVDDHAGPSTAAAADSAPAATVGKNGGKHQHLLAQVSPPLVVFGNRYVKDSPRTLVLRDKIFTTKTDDYVVNDTDGEEYMRCAAKAASLRSKRTVYDMTGGTLFTIRNKLASFLTNQIIEDVAGRELFRVEEKLAWKTKVRIAVTDANTGSEVGLNILGKFLSYDAVVTLDDGQVIAVISRKYWGKGRGVEKRGIWSNKQTYFVQVSPGVDLALMATICMCYNEVKQVEGRRAAGGGGGG